MVKHKVSFDYDNTIRDIKSIQEYCIELLKNPMLEVHIVTRRANYINKDRWANLHPSYWTEVYDFALKMGIHNDNIHFCNFDYKEVFFKDNLDYLWHLDDDSYDCQLINQLGLKAIDHILSSDWLRQCDELIHLAINKLDV